MIDINKHELNADELVPQQSKEVEKIKNTNSIKGDSGLVGQKRAEEALNFGLKINAKGYNIYVMGESGTGKASYVEKLTYEYAKSNFSKDKIKDLVYVYNFKDNYMPKIIELAAGEGKNFKKNMSKFMEKVRDDIKKAFTSTKYGNNTMDFDYEYEKRSSKIIEELNEKAIDYKLYFTFGKDGELISLPLNEENELMDDSQLEEVTEADFDDFREAKKKLSRSINSTIDKLRKLDSEFENKLEVYEREIVLSIIEKAQKDFLKGYQEKDAIEYLNSVKQDILDNISRFKPVPNGKIKMLGRLKNFEVASFFERYEVNLFVDNSNTVSLKKLPVIKSKLPNYSGLGGQMEYKSKMGGFSSNFLDIIPGDIHRANGGILIIEVADLLSQPYALDLIKRTLKDGEITLDQTSQSTPYVFMQNIKPEPVKVDLKVIFVGDSYYYDLLYDYDEAFIQNFKIIADFDFQIEKNTSIERNYLQAIAGLCREHNLKHLTKGAVEEVFKFSSRLAEDKKMLSAQFSKILELLIEADALAADNARYIKEEDIKNAIKMRKYRAGQYQEYMMRMFEDGSMLLDISGEKIGQINALVVVSQGEASYGEPAKLTASSYMGKDGVINIERETKQTGNAHDKGMMILSGYFGERYAKEDFLSFTISMTFEQNYGYIDGDSASFAELCLMFSSLGDIPLKQHIAVTGSVSQKGEIQPIGGVNEKIEGFFAVCDKKGLTGEQGVIIPSLNVQNLILSDEVVEACKSGKFHIYSIENVDEGLEILTGLDKKEIDEKMQKGLEKYKDPEDEEDSEKETGKSYK